MKTTVTLFLLTAIVCVNAVRGVLAADTGPLPFFEEAFSYSLENYWCENHLSVADLDGDGRKDIVSGTQTGSGGLIELFTNDGTGTKFEKTWQSRFYGFGSDSIETVLSVNLNNDGQPDIAAREIYSGLLVTLRGTDSGDSFVEQNVVNLGGRTFALAGGRVNGDGLTDLAVHVGWGSVRVYLNQGGSMASYWQSPDLEQAAFNLALADFDQDGFDDIFVGTFGDGALRIYRNRPGAGFDMWSQGSIPGEGYTGTVADVNGDGYPDLIVGEENRLRILINRFNNPHITHLLFVNGGATITWAAVPGKVYRVQFKERLNGLDWISLDGDVTADATSASKVDSAAGPGSQRFYRVVMLP